MLHSLVRVSRRAHRRPSAGIMGAQVPKAWGAPTPRPARRLRSATKPNFVPPGRPMPARPQQTPASGCKQAILRPAVTSHAFPPNNFKHFLTLFSKFFSSFPHGTCSLSGSHQYLALDGIYHPLCAAFPNNTTRRRHFVQRAARRRRGSHPLGRPLPGNLGTGARRRGLDRPQFSELALGDSRLGLIPVRSPLLGESWLVSCPPLIDMLKFSGCSCLNSGRFFGLVLSACANRRRACDSPRFGPKGRHGATTTGADWDAGPLALQPILGLWAVGKASSQDSHAPVKEMGRGWG